MVFVKCVSQQIWWKKHSRAISYQHQIITIVHQNQTTTTNQNTPPPPMKIHHTTTTNENKPPPTTTNTTPPPPPECTTVQKKNTTTAVFQTPLLAQSSPGSEVDCHQKKFRVQFEAARLLSWVLSEINTCLMNTRTCLKLWSHNSDSSLGKLIQSLFAMHWFFSQDVRPNIFWRNSITWDLRHSWFVRAHT